MSVTARALGLSTGVEFLTDLAHLASNRFHGWDIFVSIFLFSNRPKQSPALPPPRLPCPLHFHPHWHPAPGLPLPSVFTRSPWRLLGQPILLACLIGQSPHLPPHSTPAWLRSPEQRDTCIWGAFPSFCVPSLCPIPLSLDYKLSEETWCPFSASWWDRSSGARRRGLFP